ncbi:LPXTG cell wall anchor domain-containing protein, partial [Enterococcus gallinarum]
AKAEEESKISSTRSVFESPIELIDRPTSIHLLLKAGENADISSVRITHKETDGTATLTILKTQDYDLYDIELINQNGEIVSNNLPVRVTLPVDEGKEVDKVIYLPNTNEMELLDFTEGISYDENGKMYKTISFVASHFSEYGIVYKNRGSISEKVSDQSRIGESVLKRLGYTEMQSTGNQTSDNQGTNTNPLSFDVSKEAKIYQAKSLPKTGEVDNHMMPVTGGLLVLLGLLKTKRKES